MASELKTIQMSEIVADDSFNCRGTFTKESILDLANSIRKDGLLQNLLVSPRKDGKYDLVSGFRRFKALTHLGHTEVTVQIKELDETARYRINLIENLKRKDLNILQEAKAIEHFANCGWTSGSIADHLNETTNWVNVRLMLLRLSPEIQAMAAAGEINGQEIRDLAAKAFTSEQKEYIEMIREAKKNKEKGKQFKPALLSNRVRKYGEIQELTFHLTQAFGHSIVTQTLSWVIGGIDNQHYHAALVDYAKDMGVDNYVPFV